MTKLEPFLILFSVEYLKEVLTPKKKCLWIIQRNLENLSGGLDVGSTWVSGSESPTVGTVDQHGSQQYMKVRLSDLLSICQGRYLKVSFRQCIIRKERMLNIMMGYSTCVKWKNNGEWTWLENLIHHGRMCWKNYYVVVQQI